MLPQTYLAEKKTFSGNDLDLAIDCPKLSSVRRLLDVAAAKQWSLNPCLPLKS
jgi:hypothetical protein